jgi:transcriptional regulator with XRE-family HTH domain
VTCFSERALARRPWLAEEPAPGPEFNHDALRQMRAESDMTAEEITWRARCSMSYLRDLEKGRGNPSAELAARLAAVYGRDIRDLFTIPGRGR